MIASGIILLFLSVILYGIACEAMADFFEKRAEAVSTTIMALPVLAHIIGLSLVIYVLHTKANGWTLVATPFVLLIPWIAGGMAESLSRRVAEWLFSGGNDDMGRSPEY